MIVDAPGRSRRPFEPFKAPVRLHLLLFAHFSRSVPCATRLRAIGLCLCGGRSCKGWPGERQCQSHSKCRDENFHGVFSVTLDYAPIDERVLCELRSRNTRSYRGLNPCQCAGRASLATGNQPPFRLREARPFRRLAVGLLVAAHDYRIDCTSHFWNRFRIGDERGVAMEVKMPGDPKECRQHAKRCAELAQIARTQEDRDKFSALQMNWLSLALELDHMGALIKAMQELEAEDQSIKAAE